MSAWKDLEEAAQLERFEAELTTSATTIAGRRPWLTIVVLNDELEAA